MDILCGMSMKIIKGRSAYYNFLLRGHAGQGLLHQKCQEFLVPWIQAAMDSDSSAREAALHKRRERD